MELSQTSNRITEDIAFIKKHTQPGEKIMIFAEHEAAYYCETQTRPALKIGLTDMFFRTEWQAMVDLFNLPEPPKIFWTEPATMRARAQYEWIADGAVKQGHFVVRDRTSKFLFLEAVNKN